MKAQTLTTTYDTLVGAAIISAREEYGISQLDFSGRLGYGQGHLSRIESGHTPLTVTHLSTIASHLGLHESELLLAVEEMIPKLKKLRVKVLWEKRVRKDVAMLTSKQVNALLVRSDGAAE